MACTAFYIKFISSFKSHTMSISATIGGYQLLQLGVSLSDVALLVNQGRKFGNWFRVSSNDNELLGSIGEDAEAVLKRRDLIEVSDMEKRWSRLDFIYQGNHHNNSGLSQVKETATGLSSLSWFMITIVTALDLCLPSSSIGSLIIRVYRRVLDGDQELEDSLRVLLPTNIESWRSAGCVRSMTTAIARTLRASREKIVGDHALPQLNQAETKEMESFLVWLLKGKSNNYSAMSAMVFAVAVAIGKAGVKLRTDGTRSYESEPFVRYSESRLNISVVDRHPNEAGEPFHLKHGTISKTRQIAYPRDEPSSMIHAIPASRPTITKMIHSWDLGSRAASKMKLHAEAQLPFSRESEVYYTLENCDVVKSNFTKEVIMLAGRAFPERSESILRAVEDLAKGVSGDRLEWLQQHTWLEYLKRTDGTDLSNVKEEMELWLQYQALVFGFYYALIESLVSTEFVQKDAYFRGLWGYGSTTFLAMCVEFGDLLRREGRVSRAHVLYMLSTMYNARQKPFSVLSSARGLLGILGSVSVLSRPLLRTTDDPKEISSFVLTDLPILDLMSDSDGELFAGIGGGIAFDFDHVRAQPSEVQPRGPNKEWSLHAKMGLLFGDGQQGVVMAARCAGRLIGWFNPLAADIAFLSSVYQDRRHDGEDGYVDRPTFIGFEIDDSDWQEGSLLKPFAHSIKSFVGLVQSALLSDMPRPASILSAEKKLQLPRTI
jgi:hypothetical protein